MNAFSNNGQKPPFRPTLSNFFCPLEGQNWANVAPKRIIQQVYYTSLNPLWPIVSLFLATFFFRAKIGPSPTNDSVLNAHPTNAYTKFEVNWVIAFPEYGWKPRMDGQTDAHYSYPSRLRRREQWTIIGSDIWLGNKQTTGNHLNQWRLNLLMHICITWPHRIHWLLYTLWSFICYSTASVILNSHC